MILKKYLIPTLLFAFVLFAHTDTTHAADVTEFSYSVGGTTILAYHYGYGTPPSSRKYGCKDEMASNYDGYVSHNQSLCEYEPKKPKPPSSRREFDRETQVKIDQLRDDLQLLISQREIGGKASSARDLSQRNKGLDVTSLQEILISLGFAIEGGSTGYFGQQTEDALIQYQLDKKITPALGYFGSVTRSIMMNGGQ